MSTYPGVTNQRLSYQQIEELWTSNGGSASLAPTMAAIAEAESGGNTASLNPNGSTGDFSVGLWQINYFGNLLGPRTQSYGAPAQLAADPNAQAKAAIDLAGNGSGLSNWTTYTSGSYKQYLSGANSGTTDATTQAYIPGTHIHIPGTGAGSSLAPSWLPGAGIINSVQKALSFLFSVRFFELIGGVLLIGLGTAVFLSSTKPGQEAISIAPALAAA